MLLALPGSGAYRERYCRGGRPRWRLNACEILGLSGPVLAHGWVAPWLVGAGAGYQARCSSLAASDAVAG